MFICVCVCFCLFIYVTYICLYKYVHACTCIWTHICIHKYIFICSYSHALIQRTTPSFLSLSLLHRLIGAIIHMCDMAYSYVWHDSFTHVTWLIHVCDVTHSYVTTLIHMCDVTNLYLTWLIHTRHHWFICDTTSSYVTCLIFVHSWPRETCCIALQHTATHCNILQHTAAHCNTPNAFYGSFMCVTGLEKWNEGLTFNGNKSVESGAHVSVQKNGAWYQLIIDYWFKRIGHIIELEWIWGNVRQKARKRSWVAISTDRFSVKCI